LFPLIITGEQDDRKRQEYKYHIVKRCFCKAGKLKNDGQEDKRHGYRNDTVGEMDGDGMEVMFEHQGCD
jgi:hypothetical protein